MGPKPADGCLTKRMKVYGIVQGVGFRPSVARHASASGVTGYVCNKGPYVEIVIQGTRSEIECFTDLLRHRAPSRAVILKIDIADETEQTVYDDFTIAVSERTSGEIFIPPDIAICEDCEREMFDPQDRRYLHPFINCTSCGPRLTILDALPYDRERTSMKMFPMCRTCSEEYHDPASRRYDAQPVCCHDCGPQLYILQKPGHTGGNNVTKSDLRGTAAILRAREVIRGGGIVAVKGIGGFHLCCDAANPEAVKLLRQRKRRPRKPFAVMMRDIATVRACCYTEYAQEEILTGHQKPILLLPKREAAQISGIVCEEIAPGNPTVGVMLPYAPVQHLLFCDEQLLQQERGGNGGNDRMPAALVMTSGNISGAPICREDSEALEQLAGFCDCILSHDRRIRIRADDSVMDFYDGEPYMIRRSRGYAPLPYMLSDTFENGNVLAVGGELKNTFCISRNALFYPSSYIGDLADPRSIDVLRETVSRYASLLEVRPEVVACDMHPGYYSTLFAQELAEKLSGEAGRKIPLVRVQHHYAHIVSCMAENDHSEPVIGVAMDGTGYGTDGTIWGGEILTADYHGFERAASIMPFWQIGGDAASRQGWRIAVSMIYALYGRDRAKTLSIADALGICTQQQAKAVMAMYDNNLNRAVSTSAGRLFDAVSCILGIRGESSFEGEASMDLEFCAERYGKRMQQERAESPDAEYAAGDLLTPVLRDGRWIMRTDRIVSVLVDIALNNSEDTDKLAWLFHRMLADAVIGCVRRISDQSGIRTAALSGGCFQNRLLMEMTERGLTEQGLQVLRHSMVPPNDGGIALGQAVAAAAHHIHHSSQQTGEK